MNSTPVTRSWVLPALLAALYIACVLAASIPARAQMHAVPRIADYQYYLEFAEEAFVPGAVFTPDAIVHGGTSILITGEDGAYGLHYAVHFEPLKYVTALLYSLFHSVLVLHLFYILIFFSPLLYIAARFWRKEGTWLLLVAGLLYAVSPAAMTVASESLRPFSALFPGLFVFLLCCIEDRPLSEVIPWMLLLLLSREEGILYAAVGLCYVVLARGVRGPSLKKLYPLALLWALMVLAYGAYTLFVLPAFSFRSFGSLALIWHLLVAHPFMTGILAVIGGVCLVLVVQLYRGLRLTCIAQLFLTSSLLIPLAAAPLLKVVGPLRAETFFLGRYGMLATVTILVCAVAWLQILGLNKQGGDVPV